MNFGVNTEGVLFEFIRLLVPAHKPHTGRRPIPSDNSNHLLLPALLSVGKEPLSPVQNRNPSLANLVFTPID